MILKHAVTIALLLAAAALQADVKLPALFSNHMVLQKADAVPVWGWANPDENVRVQLGEISGSTRADANGRWRLSLDLSQAGQGPFTMIVTGENRIEIADVLVGQVWLASGQSNMEWRLSRIANAGKEIATGAGSAVREFKVQRNTADTPLEDVTGVWVTAAPGNARSFSAVGYFFAKELHRKLQQPVGIINSSWGGTAVEPWTSAQALETDPHLAQAQTQRNADAASYPQRKSTFLAQLNQWIQKNAFEDRPTADTNAYAAASADVSDWTQVRYSDAISGKDLPRQGVLWLRRDVRIPPQAAGRELVIQTQEGRGFASYYWNGQRIEGPEVWTTADLATMQGRGIPLFVTIPPALVKEGDNTLAVRIYSPLEVPGAGGSRYSLRGAGLDIALTGSNRWHAKAERDFNPDASALRAAPTPLDPAGEAQTYPARLFNGMIAPLVPYRIAGVLWYQGESNTRRAWQYRTAFPLLIEDWRKQWNEPELPFYFCQLANYMPKKDAPAESQWAELREAQASALRLPRTGQAVLIDIGEANDIHPRNKQDVADRLLRIALADTYARTDIVAHGPAYEQQAIVGDKVYLKFKEAGDGSELVARELPATHVLKSLDNSTAPLIPTSPDSQLQGFAICGADGKWVWAQARIDSSHSLVVWSPQVPKPVAVRYAWADNPTCNLYNAAGLPASPFRTDAANATTLNARY